MTDPDADIRISAFQRLRAAIRVHGGALPWSLIKEGFTARGQRFLFASAAEGIFRPAGMSGLLSVKTVVPKPKGRVWYHDQTPPELTAAGDTLSYAFTGVEPENTRNQWLRQAMADQVPLIYFFGVAPGLYEPLFPTFVTEWQPEKLRCGLSFSAAVQTETNISQAPLERRYALRSIRQRLHQAVFRERVLAAYGHRCALSGLPEPRLIDAAHIVPDDEELGQPDVRNGICMSKIHHAAFDTGLIGIDPDFIIHVSDRLLAIHDGPLLEQSLKALAGQKVRVPADALAVPDRDRLSFRFELFRSTA
ncbi:MAG TPA: HNH endonuclease [Candidatus Binataceae bacterium]|nr:HNH endonuclease [Candidatus Binataceae bacterium]